MSQVEPTDALPASIDVVIIGSSLAGLSAASSLTRAGTSFVLLEKDAVLGGTLRTLTPSSANPHHAYLDLGPSYLSPVQNFALEEILRLRLKIVETPLDPKLGWLFESSDGTILTLPGQPDTFPGGELALELIGTLDALTLMVRTQVLAPEAFPDAAFWDAMSVEQWLDVWLSQQTKATETQKRYASEALACAVRSVFAAEMNEIGFLYLLWQGATAGSFSMLVAPQGGFAWRLAYGVADLVGELAGELDPRSVRVGAEVTDLTQTTGGVDVRLATGAVIQARYVIVATKPKAWVAHRLDTKDPDVEAALDRHNLFADAARPGRCVKAWVFYKRPFWRDLGLQATVLAARETDADGPISWTLDHSWEVADPDPQRPAPRCRYAIACWISDKYMNKFPHLFDDPPGAAAGTALAGRKRAVIAQLRRLFGPLAESELLDPDVDGGEPYLDTLMEGVGRDQTSVWLAPGQLTDGSFKLSELGTVGPVAYATGVLSPEWAGWLEAELYMGVHAATLAARELQRLNLTSGSSLVSVRRVR